MKSYIGNNFFFHSNDIYVINNGVRTILDPSPSQELINHSPDGFNWGFYGPGPEQAALGILLDLLGRKPALAYYKSFEFDVVSKFCDNFCISGGEIRDWLRKLKAS